MTPPPRDQLEPVIRLARRAVRFWRFALLAFVIGMAATLGTAALLPKQYRSEAVVYYREGIQWSANEALSPRRIAQRLKDTLLARSQLAKIIEELNLAPTLVRKGRIAQAVEEMRLAIGFNVERDSDVFVISYIGDSPAEAQRVTARLTDVLIGENARLRSEQAEVARGFLDSEKKRNETELAAKEAELLHFLARHPEFTPEQGSAVASLRVTTRGQDTAPRDEDSLGALQREEERLRRQLGLPGQAPGTARDSSLLLTRNEAEAKLTTARRELADRRARFTDHHPDVRAAEIAVKDAEDALRRATQAADAVQGPASPAVLRARLARVQQDIAAHQQKRPEQRAGSARQLGSGGSKRLVAFEAEFTRLNREVVEARERLQQLDSKQFVASMTAGMLMGGQAAQIVVIDPAFLPPKPLGMARRRLFLVALAVASALALGIALLLAEIDDRIYDGFDVERLKVAPVLLEITKLSLQDPGQGTGVGERQDPRGRPGEDLVAPDTTAPGTSFQAEPGRAGAAGVRADAAGDAAGSDRDPGDVPPAGPAQPQIGSDTGSRSWPRPAASMAIELRHKLDATGSVRDVAIATRHPDAEEELVHLVELVRVHHVPPTRTTDRRLLMLDWPDSAAAASFRVLRQRLAERESVKTILVTSPESAEGKTLCALNLAFALGEAGRARVLLLEANFRQPALARLLGFRPPVCIGEQIEAHRIRSTQAWVVVEAETPWLHTATVAPDAVARPILDGKAFAFCVEDLQRAGYDYIVVDSPATLGSADVNLLQESVDGVLMTLWAGKSRGRALGKAVEQIGANKLLGVALFGT